MMAPKPTAKARVVLKWAQSAVTLLPWSAAPVPSLVELIQGQIPWLKMPLSDGNPKALHRSQSNVPPRSGSVRDLAQLLNNKIPMSVAPKPAKTRVVCSDNEWRQSQSDIPQGDCVRIKPPLKDKTPASQRIPWIAELLKDKIPMLAPKPAPCQVLSSERASQLSQPNVSQRESVLTLKCQIPQQKKWPPKYVSSTLAKQKAAIDSSWVGVQNTMEWVRPWPCRIPPRQNPLCSLY
jgi:hypothetical protein